MIIMDSSAHMITGRLFVQLRLSNPDKDSPLFFYDPAGRGYFFLDEVG
jgi:hypothetical protein